MEKPEIIKVLEDARLAHEAGDFVNALKFYEQFFDHALDDDPYALYGVRLSYCLDGWVQLAKEFVGAKNQLISKQQDMLAEYQLKKDPERFHDYFMISKGLGESDIAIDAFKQVNEQSSKSAAKLIKYVWKGLLASEQWALCNQFLDDPVQKLDEQFAIFDEACRLKEVEPSFNTDEFEQHILDELSESVDQLLMILRYANRSDDVEVLQRKFYEVAHSKSHAGLDRLIQSRGAFLFAGH
jgi:hypothetical protein